MNHIVPTIVAALLLLPGQAEASAAADPRVDEYQVKAAFLFNFAKFVVWPDRSGGPIVIGIAGDDPFGEVLDATIRGKTIGGRSLEVRRFADATDVRGCHILFVSASEKRRFGDLLRRAGAGVLTVGESSQFTREGGLIVFLMDGNKVRFQINKKAAGQSGLKIHSQLMSLAAQ